MTDAIDELGRRAGAAVRERGPGVPGSAEGLRNVVRRGRRPRPTATAALVLAGVMVIPLVAWLVRVSPQQVEFGPAEQPTEPLDGISDELGEWVRVGVETFTQAVSADAIAVADGRIVVVGLSREAAGGLVRPGIWLSDDARQWRAVPKQAVDDGGQRYLDAGLVMHDVAAIEVGGRSRLVAVGYANFEPRHEAVVWISDDEGESWRIVARDDAAFEGPGESLWAITATDDGLVAVGSVMGAADGSGFSPAAWFSATGEDWNAARFGEPAGHLPEGNLREVAASGGRLAALGFDATRSRPQLWVSDTGWAWQPATIEGVASDALLELQTVVPADDGGFLAVGSVTTGGGDARDGIVLRSSDGAGWRRAAPPVGTLAAPGSQHVHDLISDDVGLLAVGTSDGRATIWSARHGQQWTPVFVGETTPAGGTSHAAAIAATPAGMLAVGVTISADRVQQAAAWVRPAADSDTGPAPSVIPPSSIPPSSEEPPAPELGEATGATLLVSSDTAFTLVDVDAGTTEVLPVDALAGGDPLLRLIRRGDTLVFYGDGGDTYAAPLDAPSAARLLGESSYFLPSAHPDRVWLVSGGTSTAATSSVREVAMDGSVTVAEVDLPAGAIPVDAVTSGLVLQTSHGLQVWDPLTQELRAELPGEFPVAAMGDTLIWCADVCDRLQVTRVAAGEQRSIPAPAGLAYDGYEGAVSPDGRRLAVPVAAPLDADGYSDRFLAVIDLDTDQVDLLDDTQINTRPAWSTDGTWVFAGDGTGGLLALAPQSRRSWAVRIDLGPVYGLTAID